MSSRVSPRFASPENFCSTSAAFAACAPRTVNRSPRRAIVTSSAVSICLRFSSSVPQRLARRWLSTGVRTSSRGPVFKGLRRNSDLAAQRMRHRRGDGHLDELAHEPPGTAKVDDAVVSRAARELPGIPARGAFDENALVRADQAFADPARMRIDIPLKPGKPGALHLLRSIVGKLRCRGSRPPAVDERKRAVETDFVHQFQGRLEILLSLPGEPTMKSEDIPMPGLAARSLRAIDLYSRAVYPRFIAASTRAAPDCTGRCTCGASFSMRACASIRRWVNSFGCEVV